LNNIGGGRVIFTAGSEGTIKVWNLPTIYEVNQYGDTFDGKNYCIGTWTEASGEAFWDIKHHPYSVNNLHINFISIRTCYYQSVPVILYLFGIQMILNQIRMIIQARLLIGFHTLEVMENLQMKCQHHAHG
jgi:hypothetical protein